MRSLARIFPPALARNSSVLPDFITSSFFAENSHLKNWGGGGGGGCSPPSPPPHTPMFIRVSMWHNIFKPCITHDYFHLLMSFDIPYVQ